MADYFKLLIVISASHIVLTVIGLIGFYLFLAFDLNNPNNPVYNIGYDPQAQNAVHLLTIYMHIVSFLQIGFSLLGIFAVKKKSQKWLYTSLIYKIVLVISYVKEGPDAFIILEIALLLSIILAGWQLHLHLNPNLNFNNASESVSEFESESHLHLPPPSLSLPSTSTSASTLTVNIQSNLSV